MGNLPGAAVLLLSVAFVAASRPVPVVADTTLSAPPCPPALLAAARNHLAGLRTGQERIRLSTAAAPEGVEQVQRFDRAAHACHLQPGQRRRDYGEPVCRTARNDGGIPVRFPYTVHYRQAGSAAALFAAPWIFEQGGALDVVFESRDGSWMPGAGRELLDVNQDTDE